MGEARSVAAKFLSEQAYNAAISCAPISSKTSGTNIFDPLVRIKLVAQSLIARQLVRIKLVVHTDYFGELAF